MNDDSGPKIKPDAILDTKEAYDEYVQILEESDMQMGQCKSVSIRGEPCALCKREDGVHLFTFTNDGMISLNSNIKDLEKRIAELNNPEWIATEIARMENEKQELEENLAIKKAEWKEQHPF